MALTLDQLRDEALSLPVEDRRHLVDFLWESFEEDGTDMYPGLTEGSPGYLAELQRRVAEVEDGTAVLIPYEEVKRHMAELLLKL